MVQPSTLVSCFNIPHVGATKLGGSDWHVRRILRARANVAELIEVLRLHRAYFDANPAE